MTTSKVFSAEALSSRDIDADIKATWEILSDAKVTPVPDKFRSVSDQYGATLRITFYKSYGKSRNSDTGEIVDSFHILCHEFPFFAVSFPTIYEKTMITNWKRLRELIYVDLLKYLSNLCPISFGHLLQPTNNAKWIDDYSTMVLLR